MSDDVTVEITEMRFTSADDVVYMHRTQMGDGTSTFDVWHVGDPLGRTAATFPEDQFEEAKQAAMRLLGVRREAKALRDQATALERDAVAAIAETARPTEMPIGTVQVTPDPANPIEEMM